MNETTYTLFEIIVLLVASGTIGWLANEIRHERKEKK